MSGARPQLWWNINDGVFLLNFDHPKTADIVSAWLEKFAAVAAMFDRGEDDEQPVTLLAADAAASNEEFMRAIYTCLLMREPDAVGYVVALERLVNHRTSYAKKITTFLRSDEFASKLPIFLQVFQGSQDFDELIGSLAASRWRREQRLKAEAAVQPVALATEKPGSGLLSRFRRRK